jgi:hypothetical protein
MSWHLGKRVSCPLWGLTFPIQAATHRHGQFHHKGLMADQSSEAPLNPFLIRPQPWASLPAPPLATRPVLAIIQLSQFRENSPSLLWPWQSALVPPLSSSCHQQASCSVGLTRSPLPLMSLYLSMYWLLTLFLGSKPPAIFALIQSWFQSLNFFFFPLNILTSLRIIYF